jgi:hypothetical protein
VFVPEGSTRTVKVAVGTRVVTVEVRASSDSVGICKTAGDSSTGNVEDVEDSEEEAVAERAPKNSLRKRSPFKPCAFTSESESPVGARASAEIWVGVQVDTGRPRVDEMRGPPGSDGDDSDDPDDPEGKGEGGVGTDKAPK